MNVANLSKLLDDDAFQMTEAVQMILGESSFQLSADRVWRRVQLVVFALIRSDSEVSLEKNSHWISRFLDEVNQLAIVPNLLPKVGPSSKVSLTTEPRTALLEHRRLVAAVEIFLHFISMKNLCGQLTVTTQLRNLLSALLQLCYAPARNVKPFETPTPETIEAWLIHGDCVTDSEVRADDVVAEMQRDRLRHRIQLQGLTDTLFQPFVIENFFKMLSSGHPSWFRRAVSSHLSKEILRENGLSNLICALGQIFDRDTPWLQLEKVALLVSRAPSTETEADYIREMGGQLRRILQRSSSNLQKRLVVAIMNAFLTEKPDLATNYVFKQCVNDFVALIQPEPKSNSKLTSEDIDRHLELVQISCSNLPNDSALLEGFALFMPVYLQLALFSVESISSKTQFYSEIIVQLASKLNEGPEVIVACFDPRDLRFQLPTPLSFSFDDHGDMELRCGRPGFEPSIDSHGKFFCKLLEVDKRLTTQICLRLMDFFVEKPEDSTMHDDFMRVAAAILAKLSALCEETILQNEEFSTRFVVQNLRKLSRIEDPQELLKLLEILVENADDLSTISKQRLLSCVGLLEDIEGDFSSKSMAMAEKILEKLANVAVSPMREAASFETWKFAPTAMKILANKDWKHDETLTLGEPARDSLDEFTKLKLERERRVRAKSVFGTMSGYQKVKDEVLDPDVAIRGHGFIQLRKLLCANDASTLEDIEYIFNLCKEALQEEDSYIYLGAMQCYAKVVELRTSEYLPNLIETFLGSTCSKTKLLLAETLHRCIPAFGDMSTFYAENIVKASIDCCNGADELTRISGCSLLGQTVAFLTNRSSYFREAMNIFVYLITTDESGIVRRAAAEGLSQALKLTDKVVLINDYPTEVRDIHRVIKRLYAKFGDQSLTLHFQEILLTLGELARTLLQTEG